MTPLTAKQIALIDRVAEATARIPGVLAIVLGGSHARGRARPDSDIDIGLCYRDAAPIDIGAVRTLASALHDGGDPVVSGIGEWGPWVDGGAWLTIDGQRVDLLYRSLDKIEHTLADARAGRYEVHFAQQPPFGFFGPTLLGEVAIARALHDPSGEIARLKAQVTPMPESLAAAIMQNTLWSVEFGLTAFAPKFAEAGNVYGVAGCLTRFSHALVLALFALNGAYLLNEKSALAEIEGFGKAPAAFGERISAVLADIGADPDALNASLRAFTALFDETRTLCGDAYRPAWRL